MLEFYPMNSSIKERPFFTRGWLIAALILLFGIGLSIRLFDLTNLPLDFHPTRQLVSIIKARGMYYAEMQPNGSRDTHR